ncbi:MAG: cytochrome b/b6 domain-containing protein [Gammaproteobacteria bacterium]|nr:cytochrome b/b6 domain-containing protein [Gammaproteobacteria bacterium]
MKQTEQNIKVWDPLVRFFHWSLVLAFMIAYITEEDFLVLHSWSGYFIIALLLVRIIWGFIGTRHARFSDFVFPIDKIKFYLRDIFTFKAKRYIGHNPAGGAMIILLILSLLLTTLTGLLVYGAGEHAGPLADWFTSASGDNEFWSDVFEEVHEFFANVTVVLIVIHVAGVIYESLLHKENLVRAMFTGYKKKDI